MVAEFSNNIYIGTLYDKPFALEDDPVHIIYSEEQKR